LRERFEELNVNVLGRPAEVIVLRSSGVRVVKPKQFREEPQLEPKPVDMLAQLDSERGLVGQKEVNNHIEELKPGNGVRKLSGDDFRNLEKKLHDGFTFNQLVGYFPSVSSLRDSSMKNSSISSSKVQQFHDSTIKENIQGHALDDDSASTSMRISAWMPGISESGNAFVESYLRGYIHTSFTQKQRLVTQLVRQCWNLEIKEIEEDIGEVEIEVPATELELLISK
jgi:hypothetical protein